MGQNAQISDLQTFGRVMRVSRAFSFDDAEIAVAATSAEVPIGAPLPDGAIVLGVICDVTANWTDGSTGTFDLDVGDGTTDDLFTPTQVVLDGGVALRTQSVMVPAGGVQLTVTFVSSVNLSTLTGGAAELTVLYVVPKEQK